MKRFKYIITTITIITHCCVFFGQNGIPNLVHPTPEASNFLKYDFYPTDNTSGAMNVQVPIYTIKSNGMELPISLSYHTSGIKVDDIASEAGLGWVINAGGFVSVTNKGLSANNGGSAIRADWLNSQQIYALMNSTTPPSTVNMSQHFNFLLNQNWPTEASMYNYHAPGLSGGYMYRQAANGVKTIFNVPKSTDRIIDSTLGPSIINENGVKYEFTKVEIANGNNIWHLTKMSNPISTDIITFEYAITTQETDYLHEGNSVSVNSAYPYCSGDTGVQSFIRTIDREIPLLTKINFNNGYVSFVYSNDRIDKRRYRLQKIEIYDNSNTLIQEIQLHQTYFSPAGEQSKSNYKKNVNFRLKLDSITFKDKFRKPFNSYQFFYNTQYNLPGYFDIDAFYSAPNYKLYSAYYGQDLWGYNNGKGGYSFFSIGSYFSTVFSSGSGSDQSRDFKGFLDYLVNRDIVTERAMACMLTGVRYPSGGLSNFEYESNTDESGNKLGGLRISKITQNSGSNPTYKEFKYLNAHTNRFYTPRGGSLYDVYNNCIYTDYQGNPGTKSGVIGTMTSFGSQDELLLSGNPAFYSKVEEYNGTILNNTGKIEYQYEYVRDSTSGINRMNSIYYPKKLYNMVDQSWKRGQLKKMTIFRNENSTFVPVKSVENFYATFLEETIITGLDFYRTKISAYNDYTDGFSYGDILIRIGFKKLTSTIEKDISASKEVTKSTFYYYDNTDHMQVTRSEFILNDGTKRSNIYKYPDDVISISSLGTDNLTVQEKASVDKMKYNDQHRIASVVQTETFKDSNTNGIVDLGELLHKERTNYKEWFTNLILPEYIQNAKSDSALEDQIQFQGYYTNGNVKEMSQLNGSHTVYLWGYNQKSPIAKIENATYAQIATALGVTATVLDTYNEANLAAINALRSVLSDALITTYTYKNLVGVTSVTDPKGMTTFYEYDSFGRLMFVKDQNLNVLQRYCYGYKGQQVDCGAADPYLITYKSIARSGSFTRNNCASGQVGSSVAYSQPAGAATSTVSQADADAKGLTLFNTQGQANANTTGTCTFNSIARSGSFTRNNCGTGTGSSVAYSQPAGAQTSTVSQADADAKGLALFNTKGQANANAVGICSYKSPAESGSFTKSGCASGAGSTVVYNQAAGAVVSNISQADADQLGHEKFLEAGPKYANAFGTCLFNSIAYSGTFYRTNCPEGDYGSGVVYSQPAGAATGVTQSAADDAGLAKFNADGEANANLYGTCTKMITYQYGWIPTSKTLAIVAKAISNPTGYLLRFNIISIDSGIEPKVVEINMAPGQLSKTGSFILPAAVQSVQLITIWKN
ncbi:DUF5977 domain-containing protein [Flavobacterium sp. 1355]|uniref:DUF5977 domain-containing protein n=1 Tax=Flavobacterium sp. 1355 TaxID=2806571 RepID=UPI001AE5E6B6|nr:DUF5977 domain-containing protein [Flavobacterium sp. 1355]MBP1221906.1 YD repeat-containing protein [Flavobacterium sp. 1355]